MARSLKEQIRGKAKSTKSAKGESGSQTTFVIESLLLMMCLMMVIAVSIASIAYSIQANAYYAHKEAAITLAASCAERFAADPANLAGDYVEGELRAVCDVERIGTTDGALYDATISVQWQGRELYMLETSQYASKATVTEAR